MNALAFVFQLGILPARGKPRFNPMGILSRRDGSLSISILENFMRAVVEAFKDPEKVILMIGIVFLCLLSSGAFAQSGNVYRESSVQSSSPVTRGTVLQVREVRQEIQQPTRYGGMAAGAALGGALGASLGNNASYGAQSALGLLGGILGGMGGQAVAERVGGTVALEYIVQTVATGYRPSEIVAITQPLPGPVVNAGDQVYLIQTNGMWRVIVANPTVAIVGQ